MIRLSEKDNNLIVDSGSGDLAPRHESQLTYWGFSLERGSNRFVAKPTDLTETARKVSIFFDKYNLKYEIEASLVDQLEKQQKNNEFFLRAKELGSTFKEGSIYGEEPSEFLTFLNENVSRTLKEHQLKSALHLLTVDNGANFSVPGSGKTTVVLTVFEMLRKKDIVDALFVVGPPACFGPWRDEYREVLGRSPKSITFAGGDIDERHSNYLTNINSVRDLYLTSFHTLLRDWDRVRTLFSRQGIRFYLVVDEAHYIKQINGSWATAALRVAKFAKRRCILTGTPFPKSYCDAFNLFDFLWPDSPPISTKDKRRISMFIDKQDFQQASEVLNSSIGPLFYRVRKSDLGLACVFH